MPRKRTTLVLSACLSSIGLGLTGNAALGCGYSDFETGRFATRVFADPSTRPVDYAGPLYRVAGVGDAVLDASRRYLYTVDAATGTFRAYLLRSGAEIQTAIVGDHARLSADGRRVLTDHNGRTQLWQVGIPAFAMSTPIDEVPADFAEPATPTGPRAKLYALTRDPADPQTVIVSVQPR